jgi:hypothetical protein
MIKKLLPKKKEHMTFLTEVAQNTLSSYIHIYKYIYIYLKLILDLIRYSSCSGGGVGCASSLLVHFET